MDQTDNLRVMTLNIWNYNEPWLRRRELIVQAVREADPDVIGFQEIRHDVGRDVDGKNQAEQLGELLPDYASCFQPAQVDADGDRWEGLAIFSRLPIRSWDYVLLSRDASDNRDNHQRIVLHAEVELGERSVHFFDTHLSLSRAGRSRTVQEITAFADEYDSPQVLVGDFNEVSEEAPIRHVVGEFTDVWAFLRPGEAGLTYSDENVYIKDEKKNGGRRIDYIFVRPSGGIQALGCRRVADRAAADGHFPSDHFGLVADLSLGG